MSLLSKTVSFRDIVIMCFVCFLCFLLGDLYGTHQFEKKHDAFLTKLETKIEKVTEANNELIEASNACVANLNACNTRIESVTKTMKDSHKMLTLCSALMNELKAEQNE